MLAVLTAWTATGCNLPRVNPAARCAKVGAYAQDGTYVLKCNAKHRWERGITVARADAALAAWMRSIQPPPSTPPTPPPPAPPLTEFGEGHHRVGTGSGQVPPGIYVATEVDLYICTWKRIDATGQTVGGNSFYLGLDFLEIRPGDSAIETEGPCRWTRAPATAVSVPQNGDATFRVGVEIQPGWYRTSYGSCRWSILNSLDGSPDSVTDSMLSDGPQLVEILPSDVAFESRHCDHWTRLPGRPSAMLSIWNPAQTAPINVVDGTWTAADGMQFAGEAGAVGVSTNDLRLGFSALNGERLTTGTFPLARYPSATTGELNLNLSHRSLECNTYGGSVTITKIELAPDDTMTHFAATFSITCNAVGTPFIGSLEF